MTARNGSRLLALSLAVALTALASACVSVYESEEDRAQVEAGNLGYLPEGDCEVVSPFEIWDALRGDR